jgi:ubiquinone/menaquinone biosynthesis C-methylase UbiE
MGSEQASKAAQTYENYLGVAIAVPWTRLLLEYGTPRPGERVLDLACGTGSVARHVAPMVGADGKVTALDISPAMLDVARQLPPPAGAPIQWIEGDAVSLPFSDGAFDVVLCQQGLQFFSDRAAATREMRRALLRRGRAVVSVWGELSQHPLYQALFEATAHQLEVPLPSVAVSFSLSDPEELRTLLADAGFSGIEITSRSLEIHLPAPERFVQLTVLGAASSLPIFARLGEAARSTLVEAVSQEANRVAERYSHGDNLAFPMSAHIALAYASSASAWCG